MSQHWFSNVFWIRYPIYMHIYIPAQLSGEEFSHTAIDGEGERVEKGEEEVEVLSGQEQVMCIVKYN